MMSKNNSPVSDSKLKVLFSLLSCSASVRWERLKAKMNAMGLNPKTTRGVLSLLYPENFYYSRKGIQVVEGVHVAGSLSKATVGNKPHSPPRDIPEIRAGQGCTVHDGGHAHHG